ncbi:flavin-containing monooxygenase [Metabacillus sediminilitoris]|uniref:NAD(P)/FAD-dependent oxidoreductase n=1 Tax=Metabacillus sediminilitoris TaxID=2567941 RepID=A0A4S4BTN9_9BACI|nr:NAD(P)/FAD-dependent oxidoreductase [Metabacillus sediminilitoris]QGQ45466.1 NAD(P)-binding protein [Metabacillus sediminilitoris]THF77677.1 NAD(P)/FAD-dependent oxidoreductase [Metabacillus sediminilitoris]
MTNQKNEVMKIDAVVVGAGFSGLYMLYRLREAGFRTRVFEAADGVGGVWHKNRYPGARCDNESIDYNFTFSEELFKEWNWSEKFSKQSEILEYLNYVADKFDLRRDIQLNTRITAAHYDEQDNRWTIQTDEGSTLSAKYFISGVGCLSAANIPKFKGLESFEGKWYHTGNWPKENVSFKGKRVGVIGTGSTGIQVIPAIAPEVDHLTVFQRTPQYSVPSRNHAYDPEYLKQVKDNFSEFKRKRRYSFGGFPNDVEARPSALNDTPEEREKLYEAAWQKGAVSSFFLETYQDLTVNEEANETLSKFIRQKIKEIVHDPEVAEKLSPTYFYGTKRPIQDTNYYETYNRENVSLVDVKANPIVEITPKGIRTTDGEYELDIIIFATGYDAMTGSLFKIDIRGKDGLTLKEKWENGEQTKTYLGIATSGFPNMFMITGPESPSVLSNVPTSIEQHVEWISDCIEYLQKNDIDTLEAKAEAEEEWSKHCREVAEATLFTKTESWYIGANVPGKPQRFLIYLGGVGPYREKCSDVASKGYEGFLLQSTLKKV